MKILFVTVCNDEYAIGGQVMLYSMIKNIKGFENYDVKIYYNKDIAPLSLDNRRKFKIIFPKIKFEHVKKDCYFNSKLPPAGNRAQGCKAAYLSLEAFQEIEYDKVILFDVDMLCIKDISDLFDKDIQFGIYNGNTGVVVLGKQYRTEENYSLVTSSIQDHDGQFMDQGIINNLFAHKFQNLSNIYNQYPLSTMNENTRILHWAHYDHIKPWILNKWKAKVKLFKDVKPYPYPNKETGNIPVLKDKPAFDLWEKYKKELDIISALKTSGDKLDIEKLKQIQDPTPARNDDKTRHPIIKKMIQELLNKNLIKEDFSLIDMGCGFALLIDYLQKHFPFAYINGLDIFDDKFQIENDNINLYKGDFNILLDQSFNCNVGVMLNLIHYSGVFKFRSNKNLYLKNIEEKTLKHFDYFLLTTNEKQLVQYKTGKAYYNKDLNVDVVDSDGLFTIIKLNEDNK